ncbi:hypothetical protein Hdeb2414_s0003g00109551 [Helianthus debilis subsp. tardiflorus]
MVRSITGGACSPRTKSRNDREQGYWQREPIKASIISLTPNELFGGLGKEAGQMNQEWRKSIIRMQGKYILH